MAALVRVDGFLFFLLTMVHLGATRIVRREPLGRRELAYVLVFGVPFLAYWVWRTEYYGYLLPNTFYAKTSFSLDYLLRGVKYLVEFLPLYGGALLILVPFLLLNDSRWRSHSYLLALIAGWSAYTVWIGGDGLVMFRFAVPIIAPLAYLLQEGLGLALSADGSPARSSWLPVARPALQVCAALGVLAVVGLGWLHSAPVSAMKSNAQLDQARVRLGQWLQQEALSGDSLAVGAAGAMPYYSGLPTVDMLGLNDVHIAHEGKRAADSGAGHDRFDAEYVLRQQPTFIVLGPMFEDGSNLQEATIPAVKAILESEGFCRQYQRLAVPSLGRHEVVFVRLDRVSALRGVEVVRDCSYATTRAPTAVAQGPVP
jgi:arabinofuranosyltransferase